jgi:hypothetical protein
MDGRLMPGRLERHARSRWEWGAPGSRSSEVRDAAQADPDPARKAPGKKDKRRWCRGKPGVEHRTAIVLHSEHGHRCGWRETGRWVQTGPVAAKGITLPKWPRKREWVVTGRTWVCLHELQCQVCGKFLGPAPACRTRPAIHDSNSL